MRHLFKAWEELELALGEKTLVLILDYEGTLVPASAAPVRLPIAKRKQLVRLSQIAAVKTVVIDCRPAAELKRLVGVPGIIYFGHQGLEAEGQGAEFDLVHPEASAAKALVRKIRGRLEQVLKGVPGTTLSREDFLLRVSSARVAAKRAEGVRAAVEKVLRPYLRSSRLVVTGSKNGFEVRPALRWNKGTTVLWLYGKILSKTAEEKILPLYIGDGRTDEDVFRSMKPVGVSVKVAADPQEAISSDADYLLLSPGEVFQVIARLSELKSRPANQPSARAVGSIS